MKFGWSILLFGIVFVGSAGTVHAGEMDEVQETIQRIHQSIRQGIWGLAPLAIAAAALVALVIQRRLAYRRRRLFPRLLVLELERIALGVRPDREHLAKVVEAHASLLSNVVKSVLRTAKCSVLERNELAKNEIATEATDLKRGNGYFDVLYTTATLIGLLGALTGLIDAFARQAAHPEGVNNVVVTAAVAPALCSTAAGVILAFIARFIGEYIKGLHEKRKGQLEKYIRPLVLALEAPVPQAEPTKIVVEKTNGVHGRIDLTAG